MLPCPICGGTRISDAELCIRCYVRVMLRVPERLAERYRNRWLEAE